MVLHSETLTFHRFAVLYVKFFAQLAGLILNLTQVQSSVNADVAAVCSETNCHLCVFCYKTGRHIWK